MSLKLAVSRASSSDPSTRDGRQVAGRRDALGRLRQPLHRPQARAGHRHPGQRRERHADPADRRERDAQPGQHLPRRLQPLPDDERAAGTRRHRDHPVGQVPLARAAHRRRALPPRHRELDRTQRRRGRRPARGLREAVVVEQRDLDVARAERPGGSVASSCGSTSSLCAAELARCNRFASSVARMFCRTMKNATTETSTTAPAAVSAVNTPTRARSETCSGPESHARYGRPSRSGVVVTAATRAARSRRRAPCGSAAAPRPPRSCAAGSRCRPPARCPWSGSRSPTPARGSGPG